MLRAVNEFKSDAHYVKQQTEESMHNLNALSRRASQPMGDVGQIVRTARDWTDKIDRIVEEVEPPVFALARNLNVIRAGVGKFLQVFLYSNHHKPTHEEIEHE